MMHQSNVRVSTLSLHLRLLNQRYLKNEIILFRFTNALIAAFFMWVIRQQKQEI
jgi:hypothetical protein